MYESLGGCGCCRNAIVDEEGVAEVMNGGMAGCCEVTADADEGAGMDIGENGVRSNAAVDNPSVATVPGCG